MPTRLAIAWAAVFLAAVFLVSGCGGEPSARNGDADGLVPVAGSDAADRPTSTLAGPASTSTTRVDDTALDDTAPGDDTTVTLPAREAEVAPEHVFVVAANGLAWQEALDALAALDPSAVNASGKMTEDLAAAWVDEIERWREAGAVRTEERRASWRRVESVIEVEPGVVEIEACQFAGLAMYGADDAVVWPGNAAASREVAVMVSTPDGWRWDDTYLDSADGTSPVNDCAWP